MVNGLFLFFSFSFFLSSFFLSFFHFFLLVVLGDTDMVEVSYQKSFENVFLKPLCTYNALCV